VGRSVPVFRFRAETWERLTGLRHLVDDAVESQEAAGTLVFAQLQDVEQVAACDLDDHILEADAALLPELRVLRVDSSELATGIHSGVPRRHDRHRQGCAQECAQTRSKVHQPAANANHEANKKRA